MVDIDSWIIPCKNCGTEYGIPEGKITIYSLEMIGLEEKPNCPNCGTSNYIAKLKDDK